MPAAEIENAVIDQLRGLLRAPEIVVRTWKAARRSITDISEAEELLDLAAVCEEVANNIEDRRPSG